MMRVVHWEQALESELDLWRTRTFIYGESDCFNFAARMVNVLTGVDHLYKFPQYNSREQAEAILRQHNGAAGLISYALGAPQFPVARAVKGDLVVADFGDGDTVGMCLGVHSCTPGPSGLVFIPMHRAFAAWSV